MLTTSIAVVIAVAVVGVFAYLLISRQLMSTTDNTLRVATAETRIDEKGGNAAPLPADVLMEVATAKLVPDTHQVQVLHQAVVNGVPQPFPPLTPEQIRLATIEPTTVDAPTPYRVFVRVMDPRRGTTIAAVSLDQYNRALNQLTWGIIGALSALLMVIVFATWLIARRMFRPLDEIVLAANRITAGDKTTRVPAGGNSVEVRQLSDALNDMIDRLAESESNLRAFVSDASHEIRTPLTVIIGYIAKLRIDAERNVQTDQVALARMTTEAARLERLVTQLLSLDKYGSRSTTLRPVQLDALMRQELGDIEALDGGRVLSLNLQPVTIEGDEDSLRQMFANIRQNLDRHTPSDTTIEGSLAIVGGDVIILIDDSGPGIKDPLHRVALTTPRRDVSTRTRSELGFGLGMSIIVAVVSAHGGSIALEESPLGGLRTRINLPLHRAG